MVIINKNGPIRFKIKRLIIIILTEPRNDYNHTSASHALRRWRRWRRLQQWRRRQWRRRQARTTTGGRVVVVAAVDGPVVVSAHKADGARPRQKTQHRMWSDTKEKEHKRLDHRARSAPERRN